MEGQVLTMQDIFRYEQTGIDENGKIVGHFKATGIRPRFADRFEHLPVHLAQGLYAGVAA